MVGYLYIFLGIIIIITEFTRRKKTAIDYMTMLNIYFIAYYIIPAAVSNLADDYVSRYAAYTNGMKGSVYAWLMVFISYAFIYLGYNVVLKIGDLRSWDENKYIRSIKNEDQFVDIMIYALIFVGALALVFYSMLYGGIGNTLINSALIRDNAYETVSGNGSLEFIGRFIICLQFGAYFIYAKYLSQRTTKIAVAIGIVLGSLYLIIHAGRAAILTFVLTFIFSYFQESGKRVKIRTWIIMLILVSLGIIYLRPLLVSMSSLNQGFNVFWSEFMRRVTSSNASSGLKESFYQVVYNLEHKYVSLEIAIKSIREGSYHFDFFRDVPVALVYVIPSAIFPFTKPKTIDYYNTILISGTTAHGAVPPGGVAFGYYALGVLGVILFSLFVGIIGKRSEIYFDSFGTPFMTVMKTVNMFVWVDFFINGEIKEWTLRYFVFICIMIIIFINDSKVRRTDIEQTY